jgi:hypothetical protein
MRSLPVFLETYHKRLMNFLWIQPYSLKMLTKNKGWLLLMTSWALPLFIFQIKLLIKFNCTWFEIDHFQTIRKSFIRTIVCGKKLKIIYWLLIFLNSNFNSFFLSFLFPSIKNQIYYDSFKWWHQIR